jgi:hypothetical protein
MKSPANQSNPAGGAHGFFTEIPATVRRFSRSRGHPRASIRFSTLAVICCSLSSGPCGLV